MISSELFFVQFGFLSRYFVIVSLLNNTDHEAHERSRANTRSLKNYAVHKFSGGCAVPMLKVHP